MGQIMAAAWPAAFFPLSPLKLSASAVRMCVYITGSCYQIPSVHAGISGILFSLSMECGWRAEIQKVLQVGERSTLA